MDKNNRLALLAQSDTFPAYSKELLYNAMTQDVMNDEQLRILGDILNEEQTAQNKGQQSYYTAIKELYLRADQPLPQIEELFEELEQGQAVFPEFMLNVIWQSFLKKPLQAHEVTCVLDLLRVEKAKVSSNN